MTRKMLEVDVARPIVAWLEDQHFDVYQEVSLGMGDKRADIVAVQGRLVVVVETKTSLGLSVIEQCEGWERYANMVYAGVPYRHNRFARKVCERFGIGILSVSPNGDVDEERRPTFRRPRMTDFLTKRLTPEHKTSGEAGNNRGEYETPFRATCRDVLRIVSETPGICIKDLVTKMGKGHYSTPSTARTCLSKWAQAGKVHGVRCETKGRHVLLFPDGSKELPRFMSTRLRKIQPINIGENP